jgi:Holliday junction resolvase RusA-like endonuclease
VSFQAPAAKKAGIVAAIRAAIAHCDYLLGGDVKLEVRWAISVRDRYERDSSADVDNIVKPMLDALSGPDGLLIDDRRLPGPGADLLLVRAGM